jgi:hypothetical protein
MGSRPPLETAYIANFSLRLPHVPATVSRYLLASLPAQIRCMIVDRWRGPLRRPKGNGSDDNMLQKIRNQVKLAP